MEATVDAVGRDQQDQILYLKKDADTQIWRLERIENEPYQEPPDPVLDTVSQLVSSESREWTGSPTELAETVNTGMAANALTKYLNVKSGRLLDESVSYTHLDVYKRQPVFNADDNGIVVQIIHTRSFLPLCGCQNGWFSYFLFCQTIS